MKRKPGRLAEYDGAMGDRLVASMATKGSSYEEAFDALTADPPLRFREWTDAELAELIARNPDTAPARLAASEVRRREAWQTPARWSLLVSVLALLMSAVALARTF
ncbi:MAG TPA: hypothetical protein VFO12_00490 [Sphingomicrobium sp.]|nr:hypothetical protein [Sphingomicrobium sp.]